jgi:hypothetical protein
MESIDRPEPIFLGFSVADANAPELSLFGQVLTARFSDAHGQRIVVIFEDALAVRWQEADHSYGPDEQYDGCNMILSSSWLAEHARQSLTWDGTEFRHLKLNFNGAGALEVICSTVRLSDDLEAQ